MMAIQYHSLVRHIYREICEPATRSGLSGLRELRCCWGGRAFSRMISTRVYAHFLNISYVLLYRLCNHLMIFVIPLLDAVRHFFVDSHISALICSVSVLVVICAFFAQRMDIHQPQGIYLYMHKCEHTSYIYSSLKWIIRIFEHHIDTQTFLLIFTGLKFSGWLQFGSISFFL